MDKRHQGRAPRSIARWGLGILAVILVSAAAVLIAAHLASRTDRAAWNDYRRELRRRGEDVAWQKFVPPAVPDSQNFLEAPGMKAWFSKRPVTSKALPVYQLSPEIATGLLSLALVTSLPESADQSPSISLDGPASRQQLRHGFAAIGTSYHLLLEASARPLVRFNADFLDPLEQMNGLNLVNLRRVAQALATHANLSWADGQPEVALQDLQLLRKLADVPATNPTLVGGMIRVAIWDLYTHTALDALRAGILRDSDLLAIQKQTKDVNLLDVYTRCLRAERAAEEELLTRSPRRTAKLVSNNSVAGRPGFQVALSTWMDWLEDVSFRFRLRSTAWIERNKLALARCYQAILDQVDGRHQRIHAEELVIGFNEALQTLSASPDYSLARMLIPNCMRAALVTAQKQTLLTELRIACGLEQYRRAHGAYPETLHLLVPSYLDDVPRDLFADASLRYRRTAAGGYQLWSVGWDERDDDGVPARSDETGRAQFSEFGGDWVFEHQPH